MSLVLTETKLGSMTIMISFLAPHSGSHKKENSCIVASFDHHAAFIDCAMSTILRYGSSVFVKMVFTRVTNKSTARISSIW